jgi:UDP-N-acetylglucosamine 2-epimerase (non-hydrolysing)
MIKKRKLLFVLGTRPEVIKLAPLIQLFREREVFDVVVCSTGQHREMLDQTLAVFDLIADINLDLMAYNQTLSGFTSRALMSIDTAFKSIKPDAVIVQGDTTSTFVASLVSFYWKTPVAHVEAGLRTYNKFSPFPEEINRKMTGSIADWHFCPTETAKKALLKEGIDSKKIWVTGNTVVDAIEIVMNASLELSKQEFLDFPNPIINSLFSKTKSDLILVTTHRRENFGEGLSNICEAIYALANEFTEHKFVFPVHFNPNVRNKVFDLLDGIENIFLIDPVDYKRFVRLMHSSKMILTDSGGIQEEVFSLSVPTLVLRENTERGEGIGNENNQLVSLIGTDKSKIMASVKEIINQEKSSKSHFNPYGDGKASMRISKILEKEIKNNNG